MKSITPQQLQQLKADGSPENRGQDYFPVIKLYLPRTACTWLIAEVDYENDHLALTCVT